MSQSTRAAPEAQPASRRAEERVMNYRRRRVLRSSLFFSIITIVMIVVAMAQRDRQAERGGLDAAKTAAAVLHDAYVRERFLPLQMPADAARRGVNAQSWSFNITYPERARNSGRVGVCCLNPPVDLFLQEDVRFVVVFDGGDFDVLRLDESAFRQQAQALGFSTVLKNR